MRWQAEADVTAIEAAQVAQHIVLTHTVSDGNARSALYTAHDSRLTQMAHTLALAQLGMPVEEGAADAPAVRAAEAEATRETDQAMQAERAAAQQFMQQLADQAIAETEGNRGRGWRGLHQDQDHARIPWPAEVQASEAVHMNSLRRYHREIVGTSPYVLWVEECTVLSIEEERESCTTDSARGITRGVSYGARKPTIGHRYALHITQHLLPVARGPHAFWQPFIVVQGKSYWLYYHRPSDRHLARVDWPPTEQGEWTGFTVGSAPVATEEPDRVGWVIGTVDDGATVVLGLGHEDNLADAHPRNFYGISAADLTTVLWGPRSYELIPLNDDEPFKQTAGKATPEAGIVTTAEWVKLPSSTLFPARYQFGIGADAYATTPPTFYSDIIVVGQSFPVDNVDQVEVYKHWQVMSAWGAAAEQVAVWVWARTDARSFSSGPEHDAAPYSWYLYTSVGGAEVVEQQLTPAPGPQVNPYFFRTGNLSGAIGYDADVLTVYLNMAVGGTPGQLFGRIWAGRFERNGSAWVQQGDWEPSDLDIMHVASPDGATGWGSKDYWTGVGPDAEGWPLPPTTQMYTVDYGATWQEMPAERPPGCPHPLGAYTSASPNQTRVAIVEAT